jgi:hypothetical protein
MEAMMNYMHLKPNGTGQTLSELGMNDDNEISMPDLSEFDRAYEVA